jgi:tape measure domain-containing protein
MTTERINIRITADGAKATRKDIEGLGAGADRASRSLGGLGAALKAVVAGAAVRETIRIADAYTNLSNRIRVVTRDEREMGAVRSELFRVANQTRGSVETVAEVYSRLALTTKSLGLSQREVITLTEELQQATILSGASSIEAAGALRQLAQGLGTGALRGEELNSVLENTPFIAQVIADHLKVNIGQLRAMGAEGKITGKIIVDAFREARGELAEKFGKTVPTVGQSIEVLKNTVTDLVGQIDSATGATSSLSQGILNFSNDLREAIPQLKVLVGQLTDLSNIKGPGDWFYEMFGDQGVSKLEFWALGIASIKEGIAALSNVPSLGFTRAFDEAGARFQTFMRDLAGAKAVRTGAGFGRAPGTAPPDELGAKPTGAFAMTAPATKGPTVQSILADLKRENELLQMGNEQRRIEERIDQVRAQLKGKLSAQQEANIRFQLEENRVLEVRAEALEKQLELELELMKAEDDRRAERGRAAGDRAAEIAAIGADERQRAFEGTFEGAQGVMGREFLDNVRTVGQELALIFGPGGTLQQGMLGVVGSLSDAIGYSIAFNRSWNDTAQAIENIGRSIIGEVISSLIRIPIQMGINQAIASGLRAKETAEMVAASASVTAVSAAQAGAVAAAWAPAAALANAATAGGAATAGTISLTSSVAAAKALAATGAVGLFAEGGYTGDGPRAGVAGLVHGKEFVLHADATRRYRGEAEAMNAGTYRPGGGGSMRVVIEDHTDGATRFETRQLSESEIVVIVRREAPQAVADDLGSPQSRVGRSLSRNYETKKVRA